MAETTISVSELLALAKQGAIIKTEDRPTTIAGFDELLAALAALAKSNEARAAADLKQSQTQLEVLATLQALIRQGPAKAPAVDLAPLKTVLTELQRPDVQPRAAYDFAIDRDRQGFMTKIVATPIAPTRH